MNSKTGKKYRISKLRVSLAVGVILVIVAATIGLAVALSSDSLFKDATIELGTTEVRPELFFVEEVTEEQKEEVEAVTDLSTLDLSSTGEFEIVLSYRGRETTVILTIEDTTPPVVVFRDVASELVGFVLDPNEFIVEKFDYSEMTVTAEYGDISQMGEHEVEIIVTDAYGNETRETRTLTLSEWIITEFYVELGGSFSVENLVHNEENVYRIPQSEIGKVNVNAVGEYVLTVEYDGVTYTVTVVVRDTTPPELTLQDVSIFYWQPTPAMSDFVTRARDNSGTVNLTMSPENISVTAPGTQTITITATDPSGNYTTATATFTARADNRPPVLSGLSVLTVERRSVVDFNRGVSATDARTGEAVSFTVDVSGVNLEHAGTSYAVYTATDARGNTTTERRRVVINRNQEDVMRDFDAFFNQHLAGQDAVGVVATVRRLIRFNTSWGDGNALNYAMLNMRGNCYVSARVVEQALNRMNIPNQLIWTPARCHYWNLVYINGVGWRHLDATQGRHTMGPLTDAEKLACNGMHGRSWDISAWPAAN